MASTAQAEKRPAVTPIPRLDACHREGCQALAWIWFKGKPAHLAALLRPKFRVTIWADIDYDKDQTTSVAFGISDAPGRGWNGLSHREAAFSGRTSSKTPHKSPALMLPPRKARPLSSSLKMNTPQAASYAPMGPPKLVASSRLRSRGT